MYKNILLATDLAKNHFNMCEHAVKLANFFQGKLHIIHVIEQPTSLQIAQSLGFTEIYNPTTTKDSAEATLHILGESLKIPKEQLFVEIGSIKQLVLDKARELNCSLIIIGRHEAHNIPEFLESSAHVIPKNTRCDVLILN